jgi:hypothetical protein
MPSNLQIARAQGSVNLKSDWGSLAIREKALGPNHPSVAKSLENLAALYRVTDRTKEAEVLEKRAAAIRAIKR